MLIFFKDITKIYDKNQVLKNISFEIDTNADNKDILLRGPSGIGKTTLLRIAAGLERPDEGNIEITMGEAAHGGYGLRAGMVFQENRLLEHLSAVDNVSCVNASVSRQRARAELLEVLPEEALDKPVRELSGGMKRRVAIVRAILPPSDLLIMDEPFTGLDAETREKVIRYIMDRKGKRPLILASHDVEGLPPMRELILK
ncbi:ATP-binding cassette domain-containing protein [Oribacterium sp. WCC10]|uniref:ATP-binding cassette domain-containing protein n=1 Tax=Oribacterium sp. WCC10 TaxID=1855343 RepID=UPI0008EBDE19|nr:ATP-binding cassette domain-containing protein [Oribacterium sp. WCC10]SFG36343.1 NitT/TauT family transport system ATP-binding protein [Oribacterium sp. WCC10]